MLHRASSSLSPQRLYMAMLERTDLATPPWVAQPDFTPTPSEAPSSESQGSLGLGPDSSPSRGQLQADADAVGPGLGPFGQRQRVPELPGLVLQQLLGKGSQGSVYTGG
jgi:hypothetical protein